MKKNKNIVKSCIIFIFYTLAHQYISNFKIYKILHLTFLRFFIRQLNIKKNSLLSTFKEVNTIYHFIFFKKKNPNKPMLIHDFGGLIPRET